MTTPTLEETIRDLAARGEISDLSLSRNASNTKWRVGFVPCSVFGVSYAEDDDPIKALILAMTGNKLRSKKVRVADDPRVEGIPQPTVDVAPDVGVEDLM